MKNVKIMLMSLALLAVAGGVLAFKAKFTRKYCTTIAVFSDDQQKYTCPIVAPPSGDACPLLAGSTTTVDPGLIVCTTITNGVVASPCANVVNCNVVTTVKTD
jgi:hypothetical protein